MSNLSAKLKNIKTNFAKNVDIKPFNQKAYVDIRNNGLFLTDLALIHCSSIHFQSKFSNNISRRLRYTLDTIETSLVKNKYNKFIFNSSEEPELQKISSEVLSVGFSTHLMHRLFDINFNNINRLQANGKEKRCDYEILKNGFRYIYECKGRKSGINSAKEEIELQKKSYPNTTKYGCITHIPRNKDACELHVIDPEVIVYEYDDNHKIIKILEHYTLVAKLSGFYRLASELINRIKLLKINNNAFEYNNIEIEYDNSIKLGRSYEFLLFNERYEFFSSPNENVGFRKRLNNGYLLVFGMQKRIIELLEKQDFNNLLKYRSQNFVTENYSLLDNGTILAKIKIDKFKI
jgi:hypothetical protein